MTTAGIIPESLFPDLADVSERRSTGLLMARQMVEGVVVPPLVGTFARITDGALIDYQLARGAYYALYRDPDLGGRVPISARLVPYVHHVENCVTNAVRALLLCDAARRLRPVHEKASLVSKAEWRVLQTLLDELREMRHAIQHLDGQLRKGVTLATAMQFEGTGRIVFGSEAVVLARLAEGLRLLNEVATRAVKTAPARGAA